MESKIGFGFRPTDDELVGYFLRHKNEGNTELVDSINEVDICSFDPWDLRLQAKIKSRDPFWLFFSRRGNKYASGNQQSRRTVSGYWKLTGKHSDVVDQWGIWFGTRGSKIGFKRVLGFHRGNSESGRCDWIIHEYHLGLFPKDEGSYVICRLEYKGKDSNMLTGNSIEPAPSFAANATHSAGSVIDQSLQWNPGSYNAFPEYDSANQAHQFHGFFDMQQSLQGNSGSYNDLSEYDSANQDWFTDLQQQVRYSAPHEDELDMFIEENCGFLMDERTFMQHNRSDYQAKKPVSGFIPDDSGDSDTDSMIDRDVWSSTNSVGSSNGPYRAPIDDRLSSNTIEPLHNYEEQEQPKPQKVKLQGKQKVINKQKRECECKMAEDSIKKTSSANTVNKKWIVLEEMNQRNSQWIYLKNMIIGILLLISIIGWIILFG